MESNRFSEALPILTERLASRPDDGEATILATLAFMELGDNANALALARRSASLEPDHVDSWILLSLAEARYARWKPALAASRRAIELEPASWRSHGARAEIDLRRVRHTKAGKAAALRAVQLEPDNADTHLLAGRYWELLVKPRTANAAYLRALAIDPQNVEASRLHASLQAGFGNGAKVLAGRMDEVASNPGSPEAMLLLRSIVLSVLRPVEFVVALGIYLAAGLPMRISYVGPTMIVPPARDLQLLIVASALVVSAILLVRSAIQLGPRLRPLVRALVPHDRVITGIIAALAFGILVLAAGPFLPSPLASIAAVTAVVLVAASFLLGFIALEFRR